MTEKQIVFTADFEGPCPDCKRSVVIDAAGGRVAHEVPMCDVFAKLSVQSFAKYMRLRAEGLSKDEALAQLEN